MKLILLVLTLSSITAYSEVTPSAILKALDKNSFSDSIEMTSSMTIHGERVTRTMKAKSWAKDGQTSFTEFLSPPREKGIKMLKIKGDLWTYYPSADRIIKIAGHMLRNSVMGSDLSYEDMMEDRRLSDMYSAKIVGEEKTMDRPCYVLQLEATETDVAYQSRKIWVDKGRMITLREELYAKSKKLLKTVQILNVKKIQGRWYAMKLVYKDMLQKGKGTELEIHAINFDAKIPTNKFKKSALRR